MTIPDQTANTKLSVQVFDFQNNYSEPTVVVVGSSVTLTTPILNEISVHSKTITGTTQPNVLVTAKAEKRALMSYANLSG